MRAVISHWWNTEQLKMAGGFVLSFAILTGILEAVCNAGLLPPYIVPAPTAVAAQLADTFTVVSGHAAITCLEVLVGFAMGAIGGVALAAAVVFSSNIERLLYPWLVILQVIPKIALGPLLVIWLGFGFLPKIVLAFLLSFFPIMIDSIIGLRSADRNAIYLLRSMGAGRFGVFWHLRLPTALPYIFGSFKVGMTLAVVGAIVGEFIGGNKGLGRVLIVANGNLDTTLLFVSLTWICVVSVSFYAVVVLAEKFFVSWHVSQRKEHSLT